MIYDCSFDCIEPTLELEIKSDSDAASNSNENSNLEDRFAEMDLKSNVMKTNVNDEETKYSTMNDFHLAETDLIQCLLRTNILQRIT